jgi:hypothetical protein
MTWSFDYLLAGVQLDDRLEGAVNWLRVEQVARREVNAELEALWGSATQVRDLVLDKDDGPSSLAVLLLLVAELLEDHIDVAAANRVR